MGVRPHRQLFLNRRGRCYRISALTNACRLKFSRHQIVQKPGIHLHHYCHPNFWYWKFWDGIRGAGLRSARPEYDTVRSGVSYHAGGSRGGDCTAIYRSASRYNFCPDWDHGRVEPIRDGFGTDDRRGRKHAFPQCDGLLHD